MLSSAKKIWACGFFKAPPAVRVITVPNYCL